MKMEAIAQNTEQNLHQTVLLDLNNCVMPVTSESILNVDSTLQKNGVSREEPVLRNLSELGKSLSNEDLVDLLSDILNEDFDKLNSASIKKSSDVKCDQESSSGTHTSNKFAVKTVDMKEIKSNALNQNGDAQLNEKFIIDKNGYRDESDSGTDDESDSSSTLSVGSFSEKSDSSLEFIAKKKTTGKKKPNNQVKTKGELGMEDLPPIEVLSISVLEKESKVIGKIHAIVDALVVIQSFKGLAPIDLDSVLLLSHSQPLGHIFEVFGPVSEPFYVVRFNSAEDIKEKDIQKGMEVFYAPARSDLTKYIFIDELKNMKGSDASWAHNNEPPEECLDFSDDEEEKSVKRKRQMKRKHLDDDSACADVEVQEILPPTPAFAAGISSTSTMTNEAKSLLGAPLSMSHNQYVEQTPNPFYVYQGPPSNATPISPPVQYLFSPSPTPPRPNFSFQRPVHQFGQMSIPRPSLLQTPRFQHFNQSGAASPVSFTPASGAGPLLLNPGHPLLRNVAVPSMHAGFQNIAQSQQQYFAVPNPHGQGYMRPAILHNPNAPQMQQNTPGMLFAHAPPNMPQMQQNSQGILFAPQNVPLMQQSAPGILFAVAPNHAMSNVPVGGANNMYRSSSPSPLSPPQNVFYAHQPHYQFPQ